MYKYVDNEIFMYYNIPRKLFPKLKYWYYGELDEWI